MPGWVACAKWSHRAADRLVAVDKPYLDHYVLAALVTHFGIDVDDGRPGPDTLPDVAAPPTSTVPPAVLAVPTAPPVGTDRPASAPSTVRARFNPPPNWPPPPPGWTPAANFTPDPAWPAPPPGWPLWVLDDPTQTPAGVPASHPHTPAAPAPARRGGLFGTRKKDLEAENRRLTAQLAHFGGLSPIEVEAETQRRRDELRIVNDQLAAAQRDLVNIQRELVITDEQLILQEVGVYAYRHPAQDSVAYKGQLDDLKDQIKTMTRQQTAVRAATSWQINGSARTGMAMVRDLSKLMLRGYNAEADNCVRTLRPHTAHSAVDRLDKARATIAKLGAIMSIQISDQYHALRVRELQLTADYLAKVGEEKERIRAEREREREEAAARRDFEREMERLLKEQAHCTSALARLRALGDTVAAAELVAKLVQINEAITGVRTRQANTRTGYVYVISNLGAFGERMVKIGMTRRLEPMDRVRELGDASVPFRFDVHALIFSADAVTLEGQLHDAMKDRRVNKRQYPPRILLRHSPRGPRCVEPHRRPAPARVPRNRGGPRMAGQRRAHATRCPTIRPYPANAAHGHRTHLTPNHSPSWPGHWRGFGQLPARTPHGIVGPCPFVLGVLAGPLPPGSRDGAARRDDASHNAQRNEPVPRTHPQSRHAHRVILASGIGRVVCGLSCRGLALRCRLALPKRLTPCRSVSNRWRIHGAPSSGRHRSRSPCRMRRRCRGTRGCPAGRPV
jgi:hypothetical protein